MTTTKTFRETTAFQRNLEQRVTELERDVEHLSKMLTELARLLHVKQKTMTVKRLAKR